MPRFDAPNLHHSAVLFYQLTRPRGARHAARQRTAHGDSVSTHAPTRGATFCFCSRPDSQTVSTHAPARGATGTLAIYSDVRSGFNSRAREGRDHNRRRAGHHSLVSTHAPARGATAVGGGAVASADVSTHAPARGATSTQDRLCGWRRSFNSRAREGRDTQRCCLMKSSSRFNSRAREGRDEPAVTSASSPGCFNSRAREGRDGVGDGLRVVEAGFQLTRPRGARLRTRRSTSPRSPFQLTRPRGARPSRQARTAGSAEFQLTRPRGARPFMSYLLSHHASVSTHAPARGATSPPT